MRVPRRGRLLETVPGVLRVAFGVVQPQPAVHERSTRHRKVRTVPRQRRRDCGLVSLEESAELVQRNTCCRNDIGFARSRIGPDRAKHPAASQTSRLGHDSIDDFGGP